jgi:tRNA dimethylallyltransferase
MTTGESISSFQTYKKKGHSFKIKKIGLTCDREELYRRIDHRMDAMIQTGLFEEAENLYMYRDHNALQTVGYQEIFGYMEGRYDKEEAIRLLKRNSRRYAKRQLTWFSKDDEIKWFKADQYNEIIIHILGN